MGRAALLFAVALSLVWLTTGCQPAAVQQSNAVRHTIVVYGFSIEEEVLTEEIFPAFQDYWQEQTGQEVTFQSVFAGSEDLTEEIIGGAPADVAILSNEQHAVWLHVNNLVETDWHALPHQGIVSRSPLVIVVRPDNPLGIEDWADLARPGVSLVHPDPRTSGGAQWALLAEYGSALLYDVKGSAEAAQWELLAGYPASLDDMEEGSAEAAQEQLRGIWVNVVATPASSRETLKQFMFGVGDAMVTYEQDALLAKARGATLEIVTPRSTILSEHVAVIVDQNVKPWEREVVGAFVSFLWSQTAQEAFTRYYFRAVTNEAFNQAVPEFQEIERSFTVCDLGGWGRAYPEIIHGVWEEQVVKQADLVRND
jgi:ABC-type sulfate transport system substrate-binding protein